MAILLNSFCFIEFHQFLANQLQSADFFFGPKKAKIEIGHSSDKNCSNFKINGRNELRKTRAFQWCVYLVTFMNTSTKVPRGLKRYCFLVKKRKRTKTENKHYEQRLPCTYTSEWTSYSAWVLDPFFFVWLGSLYDTHQQCREDLAVIAISVKNWVERATFLNLVTVTMLPVCREGRYVQYNPFFSSLCFSRYRTTWHKSGQCSFRNEKLDLWLSRCSNHFRIFIILL